MQSTINNQLPKLIVEIGFLLLLSLLWGGSYLLIKVALDTIPPTTLIAVRVTLGAAFLYVIMKLYGHQLPRDLSTWKSLGVQAFLNSIGAWTVLAWGQQFVDSGLASVLNSTSPIFVFLLTLVSAKHQTPNALKLFGALLGLFGVVLIVGVDALGGLGQQVYAQLAILSGAVMYAGAALYGKRFAKMPATITATSTMILASICLIPASLIIDKPWTIQPSIPSLIAVIVLSIACTGFALLIYFRLLRTLGAIGTASQAYIRSGIGVLLGVWFLGETISMVVGIGLLCAIAGVAAINYPHKQRPKAKHPS